MLCLTLLTGAGCQPEEPQRTEITAGDISPAPEARPAPQAETVPLPPAGEVRVKWAGGRASVRANQAPRRAVLEHLARVGDFRVETDVVPEGAVTLEMDDAALEEAIARVLAGTPYVLRYEADTAGVRGVLAELRIGPPGREEPQNDAAVDAIREADEPTPAPMPVPARLPPLEAGLVGEWQAANSEAGWRLQDSDVSIRTEAVEDVDPERGGIVVLGEVLASDPDPSVRAAALRQLNDSESMVARQAILRALRDPDPAVVMTALEAVEAWDDEGLIPGYLEPLRQHPDRTVRELVEETIEYLE